MSVREDLIAGLESQSKTVYYNFNQGGWFKNKKIKFILKPVVANDWITREMKREALKERASGQTIEEASRAVADRFKEKFYSMNKDSACARLFDKTVIYPKIVYSDSNLKDDEVPFDLLTTDIKIFLINNIMKMSPIFQEK